MKKLSLALLLLTGSTISLSAATTTKNEVTRSEEQTEETFKASITARPLTTGYKAFKWALPYAALYTYFYLQGDFKYDSKTEPLKAALAKVLDVCIIGAILKDYIGGRDIQPVINKIDNAASQVTEGLDTLLF